MTVKIKKTITLALAALVLALLAMPLTVARAEVNAGNYIEGAVVPSFPVSVQRDAYVGGRDIDIKNATVGQSALLAGARVSIEDSSIGGSLRAAGSIVRIMGDKVTQNITAAGYTVTIDGDTTSNAVYAAGNTVTIRGSTTDVNAYGDTVILGGEVTGNAVVYANKVQIENGARIKGTVDVYASEPPVVGDKAEVGRINQNLRVDAQPESLPEQIGAFLLSIAYWAGSTVVMGILLLIFMHPTIERSIHIVTTRPIAMMVIGLAGTVVIPILLVLACFLVFTIPMSIALLVLYGVIVFFSVAFTGVSLFRVMMPKINRWIPCLLGTVVLAILSNIPYLGAVIVFVCMCYTFGFTILSLYENLKTTFRKTNTAPPM